MFSKICLMLLSGFMLTTAPSPSADINITDVYEPAAVYQLMSEDETFADFARKVAEMEAREKAAEEAALAAAMPQPVYSTDPFTITNLSVEQFNKILSGTGLEGQGEAYYKVEQEYGVNGMFAIGVAFLESGYGKYKANTNNYYGMRSGSGYMSFSSPAENILYFGKLMNKNLYKGKSMSQIAKIYCPPNHSKWVGSVTSIMGTYYNKAFN
jgi:membrane-bound lytic murein transglycosylase B